MTNQEFNKPYAELAEAFGPQNFNAKRGALIYKYVADMSASWWRGLVEHMIVSNSPKLNIAEAAAGERRAIGNVNRAREESQAMENLGRNATEAGLQSALKNFGAKSLLEAIENSKKTTG